MIEVKKLDYVKKKRMKKTFLGKKNAQNILNVLYLACTIIFLTFFEHVGMDLN